MRLLVSTDAVGGVWRYTLELAAAMPDVAVVLAVLGPACSPAQRAEALTIPGLRLLETGLPLDWTARTPAELAAAARGLAALAARERVDAVHLHAPALLGGLRWPVPVVVVAHSDLATWWAAMRDGPMPPDFTWRVAATAGGLAQADAVIAPSRAMAAALAAAYGPSRVRVIHNGRRRLRPVIGTRGCSVLAAGRLWDEAKGAVLLDAAAALLDAPVLAAGGLAGPGGERVALQAMVALGPLDEAAMAQARAQSCVFASAARYEPFGLAVLEAAQAGMALVLSDIPSLRELWGDAALFADPRDPEAFAAALRTALAESGHWGARARLRAARYPATATAAATLAVHRGLVQARGGLSGNMRAAGAA